MHIIKRRKHIEAISTKRDLVPLPFSIFVCTWSPPLHLPPPPTFPGNKGDLLGSCGCGCTQFTTCLSPWRIMTSSALYLSHMKMRPQSLPLRTKSSPQKLASLICKEECQMDETRAGDFFKRCQGQRARLFVKLLDSL